MTKIKLLFVEDDAGEIKTCTSTASRYQKEKENREISLVQASKISEVKEKIDNTFDGAIIDLRLDEGDSGNDVINEIKSKYRIPIAVMTGTPRDAQTEIPYLGIFTKGETGYDELFDLFFSTYDTGITKILGGRGYIEEALDQVFWKNILPHLKDWKQHRLNGKDTEKALLRYVVSHITEIIDDDVEKYFIQEMYVYPVISSTVKTGCVVKNKETNQYSVILSPACDLALHNNGSFKTDRILLCNIHSTNKILDDDIQKQRDLLILETDNEDTKAKKTKSQNTIKTKLLDKIFRNNHAPYFHYLPKTSFFEGGVINFRMIETHSPEKFAETFDSPFLQISGEFTKDIVSRFASYYARQGQPDLDLDGYTH